MTPDRYQRINDLFEAASRYSSAERGAFLEQACAGDDVLRREVEAMLAADSEAGGILEKAPDDLAAEMLAAQRAGDSATESVVASGLPGLGPYEIIDRLGAGGMGEVYRARDTRLGREVAIKILPKEFARDADRVTRLRREAAMLAALNHPSIAAVYDIGESQGSCFLVLELVPGKTLAEQLQRGALPIDEALPVCRQIAEALEAAHERGIIHRDLKPANVKITPTGRVKLLDFGLAKSDVPVEEDAKQDFTRDGMVFGTVPYMSPEQARGQRLDKRSDIWAFGCVLYECLTGRRLFSGQTATETIAAILRDTPKLDLPEGTPASIRLLLERCLRRDLSRRLHDIGDARIEIEEALIADPRRAEPQATVPPRSRIMLWGLGAVLLAAGLAIGWMSHGSSRRTPGGAVQLQRITDLIGVEEAPAISPDGKTEAFLSYTGGKRQIWIRLLNGGTPLQITRDDADHQSPRWAPDSSALIYYSPSITPGEEGAIWEVAALGGAARRVGSAIGGGDISHDGTRIAVFQIRGSELELATVARDRGDGDKRTVSQLPRSDVYLYPRWSHDDRMIAFQHSTSYFESGVWVVPTSGGKPRQIARGDDLTGIAWLPDGSGLVYASSFGSTVAYPPTFNLRVVGRDGSEDRQLTFGEVSYVEPDIHSSGKLVASRVRMQSDIWKIPVTGSPAENARTATRITHQTGQAQTPSVSPNDKELVYLSDSGGHGNLWIAKTDGSDTRQVTFERDPSVFVGVPVWSPAGDNIAFILSQLGDTGQWLIHPDGSGLRQLVPHGSWSYWSSDGRWLYYVVYRDGGMSIEKVAVSGGAPVVVRRDNAFAPAAAPDGLSLYYMTMANLRAASSDFEVHKASPEDGPSSVLVRFPAWRVPVNATDAHLILSPDGKDLVIPLTDGGTTNLWALSSGGGPMRKLTDFAQHPVVIARRVSWSPDSKFIYAALAESDADIVLIENLLK